MNRQSYRILCGFLEKRSVNSDEDFQRPTASDLEEPARMIVVDVEVDGEVDIHEGAIVAEGIANRHCRHIKRTAGGSGDQGAFTGHRHSGRRGRREGEGSKVDFGFTQAKRRSVDGGGVSFIEQGAGSDDLLRERDLALVID